jgi:carbamate kinase
MKIVVALGGNALLRRGEALTEAVQRHNIRLAALSLVKLLHAGHHLVVTHGNGPQVGLIALQSAAGPADGRYGLDLLGAESQGLIGYLLEQELRNLLPREAMVVTVLSQVLVSAADTAFMHPQKPIGPVYDEPTARALARQNGWVCAPDGPYWRRVVASPQPLEIIELPAISLLADHGALVICLGGGGVPVVRNADRKLEGIEAVIDKDSASGLLAGTIEADMLLMLTDVDAVYTNYGTAQARSIISMGPDAELGNNVFAAGSMAPKVEAGLRFAIASGKDARIGRVEDALAIVAGKAGTTLVAEDKGTEFRT